jgi:hypothetical protein
MRLIEIASQVAEKYRIRAGTIQRHLVTHYLSRKHPMKLNLHPLIAIKGKITRMENKQPFS